MKSVMRPVVLLAAAMLLAWGLVAMAFLIQLVGTVMHLVTLPVEFNASSRALEALESGGYVTTTEAGHAKKVLDAAALTYVAAALMGVLQLVRLLLLSGLFGGRRDD